MTTEQGPSAYLCRPRRSLCDDCDEAVATETWGADAPFPVPLVHLCSHCADRRRDHATERAMEE